MRALCTPVRRAVPASARILVAISVLGSLMSCGRDDDALAAHGAIDWHAPVQATVQVSIKATPAIVWRVLTDIARWPAWQPDIETTKIATDAAAGVPFVWTISGGTINSHIVLYEPERRLAWVGRLLIFRAIHVWELSSRRDGETTVTTTESLGSWPITWFYSSDSLHEADRRWLAALKQEAEQQAVHDIGAVNGRLQAQ